MKNAERFICVHKQNGAPGVTVWVDVNTGVNYLFIREGFAGGLSPLLDENGKVVVSKEYIR